MKYYTGIGSRRTPPDILSMMTLIAKTLYNMHYVLRSGAADGADSAFEEGAGVHKEIFIPWNGFNNRKIGETGVIPNVSDEAMRIAGEYHPAWHRCSFTAKKLHARNVYQVLGLNLDEPSNFVICWTPNGSGSGGTGQAIRIAKVHNIPVFDLGSIFGHDEFITHLDLAN